MSCQLKYLQWDSDFFGMKIGSVNVVDSNDVEKVAALTREAFNDDYELLYLFSSVELSCEAVASLGGCARLTDRRIVFEWSKPSARIAPEIEIYRGDSSAIYPLAYQAGHESRFHTDPDFSEELFRKLYRRWVDNAFADTEHETCMAIREGDKVVAFASVELNGQTAHTGLIAVDEAYRGRGYGSRLIEACMAYANSHGVTTLLTPTQTTNVGACRFYRHLGMKEETVNYIYHIWNK